MRNPRDWTIKTKLICLLVCFVGSFGLFLSGAGYVIHTVAINGEIYRKISMSKDLVSDILPPPLFIVEPYQLASHLVDEASRGDPKTVQALISRLRSAELLYSARYSYWQKYLTDPELKRLIAESSKPAFEFFRVTNEKLIPAVQRHDMERADKVLDGELQILFLRHRSLVEQAAARASNLNAEYEADATAFITRSTMAVILIGTLLAGALAMLIGYVFMNSLVLPLQTTIEHLEAIGGGHYDNPIEVTRNDEIGVVMRAVNVMQRRLGEMIARIRHDSEQMSQLARRNADMTAQLEKANQELQTSFNFLQTVLDHLPVAVFVKNARPAEFGRFILWNKTCETLFGPSRNEAIGKTDYDFFPKEQSDFFCRKDRESFEKGAPEDISEEPINSRSLGPRLLHTTKVPLYDEQGAPLHLLGISQDITERKRADEALLNSEHRFASIFQTALDAIITMDAEQNIQLFNPAAEKLFGVSASEVIGGSIDRLIPQRFRARHREHVRRFGESGSTARTMGQSMELSAWHADGYEFPIEAAISVAEVDERKLFTVVLRDITERQRAEEAVRESEQRIRLLLDSTAEAIYGINSNGECTFCNPACLRMLGYKSADELLGRNMHFLIHHTRPDGTAFPVEDCRIFQAFQTGEGTHVSDEVLWRADGTSFAAEYWSYPVRSGDDLVGAVVTFIDISERKALERMKSEFVSLVSHELRTPLTSIRGALGLLAAGMLRTQPEKAQRMLDIAVSSTDRLVRLINDILDIERMESGKVSMRMQASNAADLVNQAVETMRAMAEKAHVTINVSTDRLPLRVDPDRILQVLTNLLSNAIKFSPPQGTIWISTEQRDGEVLFQVRDQGRGIPANKLDSIFGRFQQVDSSDARDKGGTGLGLAICRMITQQHGGHIGVESRMGEGSRFFFTLPLASEQPVKVPAAGAAGPIVLVCDDDDSIRTVVGTLLERYGYRVLSAASGEQALRLATTHHPAVVLLDLIMPGMDGWQTMAALRSQPATMDIPIVVLSVVPVSEAHQNSANLAGWVQKPFDEDKLFESLQGAIGKTKIGRVLIVEDDMELAAVLIALFENREFHVFHASTASEAIQFSEKHIPDLLVLDVGLPDGDGFGIVDWLRRNNKLRQVPLVVYTGRDLSDSERERLKLGPTQFLAKDDVSPQEFERIVVELLSRVIA